jgi:hypothetical protein
MRYAASANPLALSAVRRLSSTSFIRRQLGLVELEERGGRGELKIPLVLSDEIQGTIALRLEEEIQAA